MTIKKFQTIRSEKLRDQLLQVMDGVTQLAPVLWYINEMVRAEDACAWLIKNKIVGRELMAKWHLEFKGSFLEILAMINKGLDKEDKIKPVLAHRDFRR